MKEATYRTRDDSTVREEQRAALGGDEGVSGGSQERKDRLRRKAARGRSNSENQSNPTVRRERRAALGGDEGVSGGSRE